MTSRPLPNGSGAAAILAAGTGAFVLGLLTIAGDKSAILKGMLNWYAPTGPLSGVTTLAIILWLTTWALLDWRWKSRTVHVARVNVVALTLLALGLLLTFPPFIDVF